MSTPLTSTVSSNSSTTTLQPAIFDSDLDTIYGTAYCMCFAFGLLGNITSFCYFVTKKTDLPNTLYRVITAIDGVISLTTLAVGITLLSFRDPGFLFGNNVVCTVWTYVWHVTSRLSIFLVVVLSVSRTYYLIKPFYKQRIAPSVGVIVAYSLFQVGQTVGFQSQDGTKVAFVPPMARCVMLFATSETNGITLYLDLARVISFILPMCVVFVSSAISIKVTLKKRDIYLRNGSGQTELRKSRNRATLTIILFALVYALFNGPLVVSEILHTIDYHTNYKFDFHSFDYNGKYLLYYDNFVSMLSVSLNAAINPLLYLWRMPSAREFVLDNSTPHKIRSRREREQRRYKVREYQCPAFGTPPVSWALNMEQRRSAQGSDLDISGENITHRVRVSMCM